MKKNTSYSNDSITSLKGADRVRKRPSVIFGSDGVEGCQHSIFEILSNSIDEAREGFGSKIEITRFKDRSVAVRDYAQGIPVEYNEREGRFNWELIFCELYAGGKFANNEDGSYTFSLGLNGLGLCATQYSSEYMDVSIRRDGFLFELHFEKGENIGGLKKRPLDNLSKGESPTGTAIRWRPDTDVFTDIDVPLTYYQETLKRQAIVNAGLTFELYDEESDSLFTYRYENGIKDYIAELTNGEQLTESVFMEHAANGRDREDKPEYRLKFELIFCFSGEICLTEYYHNSSFLEYGGSPEKAVKSAFVYAIDSLAKNMGLYKKDEKRISYNDVADSLVLISNSFSTVTSYENQTKKSITNKFIQDCMTDFLKKRLTIYFIENQQEAEKIANQILINKRSRESAEKARVQIKKKLTGSVDIGNRVDKFVNCRTKDTARRELYIVEGDSALGACKLSRDAEFQAIMPLRGKILNCLKADYDKIFSSDIITDILRILGCGVEIVSRHGRDFADFDLNQLKWSKIIIATDADVDGFHIRTQVLAMLFKLLPSVIEAKKIFIVESPLYEITSARKTFFAYSDKEKNDIVSKLGKHTIQRSKGLGENEPEMMWQTTMCPDTRRLVSVQPEDIKKTRAIFDLMLGENLKGRKEFIEIHGHKYIDLTEVV